MKKVSFDDSHLFAVNESEDDFSADVKIGAAILFYIKKKITLGQAASLADMDIYSFMKYISKISIPVLDYPPEELKDELA